MNHAECVDIAFQAILMKQNGASPLEIREYFDKQYKKDGRNVTPTPLPSS